MAPKNTTRPTPSGLSTGGTSTPLGDSPTAESLAQARQEIDRLTSLLQATQDQLAQAQETTDPTPATEQNMATWVDTLVQALRRSNTPAPPPKSSKVPDPPPLTDGKDPTFISWKKQIASKLTVNADHFADETARINYVFSRTGGEAQGHLEP